MDIIPDKENIKLSESDIQKILESENISKEERRKLKLKLALKKLSNILNPDASKLNKH